jgi:hypothetical protein
MYTLCAEIRKRPRSGYFPNLKSRGPSEYELRIHQGSADHTLRIAGDRTPVVRSVVRHYCLSYPSSEL